jgi:hypothetical protein
MERKEEFMTALTHSKNSAILLLLTALALSAVTARASENLPFRLGDEGTIAFSGNTATTAGTGNATLMGRISSEGRNARHVHCGQRRQSHDRDYDAVMPDCARNLPWRRDLRRDGWHRAICQRHRLGSVRRHRQFHYRHNHLHAERHHFDKLVLAML